jgi:hypothetical protein
MTMTELTRERVLELLDYEPTTGKFFWKKAQGSRVVAGQEAGSVVKRKYRDIRIDGVYYRAHRLVWLVEKGTWPSGQIDHEDRDRTNNRIGNLRDVTQIVNLKNQSKRKNNTSGHTGVRQLPSGNWIVQLGVNRKRIMVGIYPTVEEAVVAREQALSAHNFHPNHGL